MKNKAQKKTGNGLPLRRYEVNCVNCYGAVSGAAVDEEQIRRQLEWCGWRDLVDSGWRCVACKNKPASAERRETVRWIDSEQGKGTP
jgi:hypothetical protein